MVATSRIFESPVKGRSLPMNPPPSLSGSGSNSGNGIIGTSVAETINRQAESYGGLLVGGESGYYDTVIVRAKDAILNFHVLDDALSPTFGFSVNLGQYSIGLEYGVINETISSFVSFPYQETLVTISFYNDSEANMGMGFETSIEKDGLTHTQYNKAHINKILVAGVAVLAGPVAAGVMTVVVTVGSLLTN